MNNEESNIKREKKIDYALLGFFALLFGASFPPLNTGYFAWIAFVPYFYFLERNLKSKMFRKNFLTGFVANLIIIYWIGANSGASVFVGVLTAFGSVSALALWFTLYGWVQVRLLKKWGDSAIWAAPFVWVGIEFIRAHGSLAFPWTMIANTQTYYVSLIQFASITGAWGVSLLLVFVNVLLFKALKSLPQPKIAGIYAVAAGLALFIPWLYGTAVLSGADAILASAPNSIKVSIVQPNIDPRDKWNVELRDEVYRNYGKLTAEAGKYGPDLIIWPETATPAYLSTNRDNRFDQVLSFVDSVGIPLLTGTLDYKYYEKDKFHKYNSCFLLRPGTRNIERYHKMFLVPFAEKVPFEDKFPFLSNFDVGQANFTSGENYKIFNLDGKKFSVGICFESVFPSLLRTFVKGGSELIIIITNDAWFGNTSGPYQHAQIAVLRAIENHRSVARCANTGISELIDPFGRIIKKIELGKRGVLSGELKLLDEETIYNRYGDYIGWITALFTLLFVGISYINKPSDNNEV